MRRSRNALRLALAAVTVSLGYSAGVAGIDEVLRGTLLQMGRDDLEAIRLSTSSPPGDGKPTDDERKSQGLHRRNGELIRTIVEEHGWPGRRLVGDDGASSAWIVVQHMDEDPAFQRRCLSLMEAAFIRGDVSARDLSFLTDRVLTAEHKPQKYGTQGAGVTSPEEEARVDKNRAAIGLPPWSVFTENRRKEYAAGKGHPASPPTDPAPAPPATARP